MLRRYRRHFAIATFLLLATPLIVGIVKPDSPASILKEGRNLAPAPKIPADPGDWLMLPKEIDAYLQDRFGFRQALIKTNKDLTNPLLAVGDDWVLIGRAGRMFYLGEAAVRQSAGMVLRRAQVAETADTLASIRDALDRRGIRFLVAPPPNSSTIYQDDLPGWARNRGKMTEYDLLLDDLAARGMTAVDLRPALKSARSGGSVFYMHDTHWTNRGALAGFNAIVEADSHPDWRIEPSSALGPSTIRKGGDLARMFGVEDRVTEDAETLTLPDIGKIENLTEGIMPDYMITSERRVPTIMVIGDSFTNTYFLLMLARRAGRAIWLNHKHCGFEWKWIDKFHPDEVWWMPVERFLVCNPGARPLDFAG
jgi:alginate O-acetyltransferase complex protein AlgJ